GAARESEIPDLAQRVVILHMHAEEFATEVDLVTASNPMERVGELERGAVDLSGTAALNREVSRDSEPQVLRVVGRGDIRAEIRNGEGRSADQIGVVAIVRGREAVQHVRSDGPRVAAGKTLVEVEISNLRANEVIGCSHHRIDWIAGQKIPTIN